MTYAPKQPNPDQRATPGRPTGRELRTLGGAVQPDDLARIERAMSALPRTTREVFLAHRLDSYSYDKMARITGMSIHRVERHMAAAIHHLSRFMDGDERSPWQRWWQSLLPRWRR
ncbi:sigma-70 region 4 domain-containing protein [Sphingomonas sp. PB4P5]|uniref:sigma-70 region 4 domain-containing protein n=1 Tax=Parasphingomonas puruogangriensis TaxID=3096155 RepID=UPI002FC7E204